jgi:hypothetical protein
MKQSDDDGDRQRSSAEERLIREAALDETIAQSFPASDPLSTNPNPDTHEMAEELKRGDPDRPSPS